MGVLNAKAPSGDVAARRCGGSREPDGAAPVTKADGQAGAPADTAASAYASYRRRTLRRIATLTGLTALLLAVFLAALIAIVYQGVKVSAVSDILMNGFKAATGDTYMDKLLSKGGIMSMTWVIMMMMLSLAFVGCLEAYGTFRAILAKLNALIKSRFSLVATAASAVLIVGLVAGEVYTSIVLPGRLMKGKFAEMGYDRSILSRTIEDWGTLVSPLIPWNNGGAFVTSTLGISTFLYAPFALFCWLSPLIGLIYAALGWFTPLDPKGPQKIEEEEMEDIADEVQDYMV